jgi:hypothetical protein
VAHQEDDGRRVRGAVVGQAALPGGIEKAASGNGVDVVGEGERDDVGVEAVDDGARLSARSAVRLLDVDGLAGGRLVVLTNAASSAA